MSQIIIDGVPFEAGQSENRTEVLRLILDELKALYDKKGSRVIAFLGGPIATGKTTLLLELSKLAEERGDMPSVQCIGLDGFHYPNAYLDTHAVTVDGVLHSPMRTIKGWPETFNVEKLYGSLEALSKGERVMWPGYDRVSHDITENVLSVDGEIIIIEGLWMMYSCGRWKDLHRFCDYGMLIFAKGELLRERALQRKIRTGSEPKEALAYFMRSDTAATEKILKNIYPAQLYIETDRDFGLVTSKNPPENMEEYLYFGE